MPHEVQSQISQYTFQSNIFQPARTNAIYYPNWRARDGQTPATLNFNCINFVYYAFANVNPDGTVTLSDEDVDLRMSVDGTSGCINSLMRLKKQYYYLKVILSIGGANGSQNFSSVASNAAYRDNFARTARGLVEGLGFDGIDIDWESPKDPQEGNNFIALLAAIRTQLPPFRYYVTAALPAGEWALQNIDIYKSQSYLDLINLMAYDFNGSWTTRSGYQSQLFSSKPDENSGDKAVHYLLSKGFPVSKILLGIPVYGRSFLGAAGPGQTYTGLGGNDGAFAYNSLPRPNASENVDRRLVSAYCVGGDGGFISYDNPDTVKLKANYCNAFGLAGLFYWEATQDAGTGPRSLIYTGFNALNGSR
ncbi:putative sporulation-specific chitinase [Erysiphe necator]|uniref:chitinase n=1 Tax=Uncinula necator TaxID=52586 RepID=A0A0B1NW71_UNCNE|nr:putative sporulation-specific chitinase [Erysiphe necator]